MAYLPGVHRFEDKKKRSNQGSSYQCLPDPQLPLQTSSQHPPSWIQGFLPFTQTVESCKNEGLTRGPVLVVCKAEGPPRVAPDQHLPQPRHHLSEDLGAVPRDGVRGVDDESILGGDDLLEEHRHLEGAVAAAPRPPAQPGNTCDLLFSRLGSGKRKDDI
jgi:hypothetical protein